MNSIVEKAMNAWREMTSRLTARRDSGPIATVEELNGFVATRSAFVAQKKLYGYLKARMGTRYPSMFEDDFFVQSINVAKMHVFAACLSDMTVFAVARLTLAEGIGPVSAAGMASQCYRAGLAANGGEMSEAHDPGQWIAAFERRLAETVWANVAAGADCFVESPPALVKWAPIAPELKRYDVEIVENSIRYAWTEIRRSFRSRLDAAAVIEDWNAGAET